MDLTRLGDSVVDCEEIQGLVAASLYESLDGADREAVERHLTECAGCRNEVEGLNHLIARIPTPQPRLDRDLRLMVRRRIAHADLTQLAYQDEFEEFWLKKDPVP